MVILLNFLYNYLILNMNFFIFNLMNNYSFINFIYMNIMVFNFYNYQIEIFIKEQDFMECIFLINDVNSLIIEVITFDFV